MKFIATDHKFFRWLQYLSYRQNGQRYFLLAFVLSFFFLFDSLCSLINCTFLFMLTSSPSGPMYWPNLLFYFQSSRLRKLIKIPDMDQDDECSIKTHSIQYAWPQTHITWILCWWNIEPLKVPTILLCHADTMDEFIPQQHQEHLFEKIILLVNMESVSRHSSIPDIDSCGDGYRYGTCPCLNLPCVSFYVLKVHFFYL